MRGGVLIIGSLYWDQSNIRKKWRDENLVVESQIQIPVPIRYGRKSETRNNTYTMVYSNECKSSSKLGTGLFLPFKSNPINLNEIFTQCVKLKEAECNRSPLTYLTYHWAWAAIVYAINPQSRITKKDEVGEFQSEWSNKLQRSNHINPSLFNINNEGDIVRDSGQLDIEWPSKLSGFDFLISTATKPNIQSYPDSKEISTSMINGKYFEYFENNRACGISTFQDNAINIALNSKRDKQK